MADLSITAASVLKSSNGTILQGTAGATITQGQAVYIDTTDSNKIKLADSNGTAPANTCAGIALNAASSGQPVSYCGLDSAFALGATVTSGAVIYLSNTPGGLTATYSDVASGSTVIAVGGAVSTSTMNLNPQTYGTK